MITLYNYTGSGNGVPTIKDVASPLPGGRVLWQGLHCDMDNTGPSVTAVTLIVNGREKYVYPTDALTKGGEGYSPNTTSVSMTVIYTMDTKRNPLPTGYL